jgi:hypothetical protein
MSFLFEIILSSIFVAFLAPGKDAPDIRPDNHAFFISGIRPDTGFHCWISSKAGYRISARISGKTVYRYRVSGWISG